MSPYKHSLCAELQRHLQEIKVISRMTLDCKRRNILEKNIRNIKTKLEIVENNLNLHKAFFKEIEKKVEETDKEFKQMVQTGEILMEKVQILNKDSLSTINSYQNRSFLIQ